VVKREKKKIPTRSAGLVITPPQPRPDDDNPAIQLFREAKEAEIRASEQPVPGSSPTTTHHPPPTDHPPPTTQAIAPQRDFTRVPNSVVRDAVPSGLFKGESKKLYDSLYQRTRGFITPRRSIRATQADLMDWARVSRNTLKAHIKHLSKIGLLKVHYVRGENTGAEYEIFTPEELLTTTHHPPPTTQNLTPPTTQNLGGGWWGQVAEESTTSGNPKTLYKTNTERSDDDDEAFADFIHAMKEVFKEVAGRAPNRSDRNALKELAQVLAAELQIAASRTTVSAAAPFLTAHLRRRLGKADARAAQQSEPQTKASPATKREFTEEPCPECQGALFVREDDGGRRKCTFCRDNVGYPTGRKPKEAAPESSQ
jgi:hypothetical protein